MAKRGYERIERLWDEKEAIDPKQEQFASSARADQSAENGRFYINYA
jgi:hypothetical protein